MGDRAYEIKLWKEDPALARRAGYKPPSGAELEPLVVDSAVELPPMDEVQRKLAAMETPLARFVGDKAAGGKTFDGLESSGPAEYLRKRHAS